MSLSSSSSPTESKPAKSIYAKLNAWGSSSMPPMGLATLVAALHARPFQPLPMLLFTPVLLLSGYLNIGGFKVDSAGLTAAWSGLYALLAARRRPAASLRRRFTARGAVRLTAMGLASVNTVAGAVVYATGDREAEKEERQERDRWGIEGAKRR